MPDLDEESGEDSEEEEDDDEEDEDEDEDDEETGEEGREDHLHHHGRCTVVQFDFTLSSRYGSWAVNDCLRSQC